MTPFSIEDIIANYTPDEIIPATLPDGKTFTFRGLRTMDEVREHREAVARWFHQIPSPLPDGHLWEGLAPTTHEAAYNIFTLSELSIEPKISQMQAMRMQRAPSLMEYLLDTIETGNKSIRSKLLAQEIEKAKKNSEQTDSE